MWPYEAWEDWEAGLYALPGQWSGSTDPTDAAFLLSDPTALAEAMRDVIKVWKVSTRENLTNGSLNQRAWIGQAACCLALGVPAFITKSAWNGLSLERQRVANRVADQIIETWRGANAETLFG